LEDQLQTYRLLVEAFGQRGGVPALIIECAVPQVEALANELLDRMTAGRLSLRLETQVETKSGTVSEALRIYIADEGHERPYQTYSGAERLMCDLALRVALSKFLTHRAGAELRLLVIDEGFGALDPVGKQRLMEALFSIAPDFGLVLCITHLSELQDQFPRQLVVSKTSEGSRVEVV